MSALVLWSVVQIGSFYGLLGLAYLLVARSTGLLNFSIGAYAMLGGMGYGYFSSERDYDLLVAVALGLLLAVVAALATEVLVVRRIADRGRDEFAAVMALVALLFVLEQVAAITFGRQAIVSGPMVEGSRRFGNLILEDQQILGVVAAVAVFVAVAFWIQRSSNGRMLRAVGDNERAADALGLPVRRVRLMATGLAGLVAGAAGVAGAPLAGLTFESATSFAIVGFIAMVLGGTASAWAPLAGGLLLSGFETYGARYIGGASGDYILLGVILVVFTFRPEGIFSVRVRT